MKKSPKLRLLKTREEQLKKSNRRTEHRVRLEIKASVGIQSGPEANEKSQIEDVMPCMISDISIGGVKIVILNHSIVDTNAYVRVYIKISRIGKPLELTGIVRWRHMEPGSPSQIIGVEFLVPEQKTLDRWLAYATNIIDNAPPEDLVEEKDDDPCPWSGVF